MCRVQDAPLGIRVEMLRGQVATESGVRGARFGAAWTERGHRWLLGKAGQSQGLPVVCPKPEKEGSALQSSGDPQSEGAGRPPRWLLSVSSEPVLLARVSWLTPLHCRPPRSPGLSGDSSFS